MFWLPVFQWILFIIGSAGLIFVSRKALLRPSSHGFTRFFAWEILLGMFLLNTMGWFKDPLAWHQLISWGLLIAASILVIQGVRLLRDMGKQFTGREHTGREHTGREHTGRENAELFGFEKTTRLVTAGLYRFIRHPLYSSLLFLGWGVFFKSPSWMDLGLALLCTFFLIATARAEERENISYFGREYVVYMKQTKMFIPFIL